MPKKLARNSAPGEANAAALSGSRRGRALAAIAGWCALVVYSGLFLTTTLPSLPPDAATQLPMRRIDFWQFLPLPELLWAQWCGPPGSAGIADRLPILGAAAAEICVAAACGWLALVGAGMLMGLTRVEKLAFSIASGCSLISLATLAAGLAGWLRPSLFIAAAILIVLLAVAVAWRLRQRAIATADDDGRANRPAGERATAVAIAGGGVIAIFGALLMLSSLLPPTEFDVLEYHLEAPKEFFQAGRIGFVPYNVYENLPLGSEMLTLAAMTALDDWRQGALVGKAVLAALTLTTTLAVWCLVRRYGSQTGAWLAAVVYLSTPWIFKVSTSGLVEGATALYLALALYAVLLWSDAPPQSQLARRRLLLAGFLAGTAVACKLPAALFVAAPLAAWIAARPRAGNSRPAIKDAALFLIAASIACGPWFVKNWLLIGNPVYPLLGNVFGGGGRSTEVVARWQHVHRPPNFSIADLAQRVLDVLYRSEWLSPLLVPLVVLAVVRCWRRPLLRGLVGYGVFIFAAWWLLTHRLDRFWLPALPVAAIVAGLGIVVERDNISSPSPRFDRRTWWLATGLIGLGLLFNLLVVVTGAAADNAYFERLEMLWNDPAHGKPWHIYLNESVPPGGRVLLVGDAQPFDLTMPVEYNTVFDNPVYADLLLAPDPATAHARLLERHISRVLVDWGEIARYRSPGNYGFPDFVQPELFERLVKAGVLIPDGLPPALAETAVQLYRVPPKE